MRSCHSCSRHGRSELGKSWNQRRLRLSSRLLSPFLEVDNPVSTRELKGAPALVTGVSRWHAHHMWPHACCEGCEGCWTEWTSQICPRLPLLSKQCCSHLIFLSKALVLNNMDPESDQQMAMENYLLLALYHMPHNILRAFSPSHLILTLFDIDAIRIPI